MKKILVGMLIVVANLSYGGWFIKGSEQAFIHSDESDGLVGPQSNFVASAYAHVGEDSNTVHGGFIRSAWTWATNAYVKAQDAYDRGILTALGLTTETNRAQLAETLIRSTANDALTRATNAQERLDGISTNGVGYAEQAGELALPNGSIYLFPSNTALLVRTITNSIVQVYVSKILGAGYNGPPLGKVFTPLYDGGSRDWTTTDSGWFLQSYMTDTNFLPDVTSGWTINKNGNFWETYIGQTFPIWFTPSAGAATGSFLMDLVPLTNVSELAVQTFTNGTRGWFDGSLNGTDAVWLSRGPTNYYWSLP